MTIRFQTRTAPNLLDRILVPLDGSPRAEEVFAHLLPVLDRRKGEVFLLTVLEGISVAGNAYLGSRIEDGEVDARHYLHRVSRELATHGTRSKVFTHDGPATEAIRECAERHGATLIALATHGHTGLSRLFFGSVTESVLRTGQLPVLVTRTLASPGGSPRTRFDGAIRRILVPTDGSPAAETVVDPAIDMARATGATVTVMYVSPAGKPAPRAAYTATGCMAGRFSLANVPAATVHLEGDAASKIAALSQNRSFDMIAMSTHGRTGLRRLVLGSVTERVLRAAEVPVLVTRSLPGQG